VQCTQPRYIATLICKAYDLLCELTCEARFYLALKTLPIRYEEHLLDAVRESFVVYCETHTKHTDTLTDENIVFET
jgi:hypothetical protein